MAIQQSCALKCLIYMQAEGVCLVLESETIQLRIEHKLKLTRRSMAFKNEFNFIKIDGDVNIYVVSDYRSL